MSHTARIVLALDHGGQAVVDLRNDGTATVGLHAAIIARKDVTGPVAFDATGSVVDNDVQDSFSYKPLTPYVLGIVDKRAAEYLARAKVSLRRITSAHPTRKDKP